VRVDGVTVYGDIPTAVDQRDQVIDVMVSARQGAKAVR
jgi:hypothetical protein